MMDLVLVFSVLLVVCYVGVVIKPSPIYGGLGLLVGGLAGCGMTLGSGGPFLGMMMFLIYLGGMLVIFGYTTAMASEEFPETWTSNWFMLIAYFVGIVMEMLLMGYFSSLENVTLETKVEVDHVPRWLPIEAEEIELVAEDGLGVAAMYEEGGWVAMVIGWILFASLFIVLWVTHGI
uniref:NADH-ubiquinone oxidoreductase chain 6 n=1 Tax=Rhizomys sumatrensis TaxID=2055140 RepID=A0A343RAM0_9RODE|nr:NADH dehydrogenase subunit 6 [Rhizomys sumatrensis]ATX68222.1 NADH dehydrogenase subunit 6 [Rhizomys sumatrensis]